MFKMTTFISNFQVIRPDYEYTQQQSLEWLSSAHAKSEALRCAWAVGGPEFQEFYTQIKERLFKIGLGMDKIQKRSSQIRDAFHQNWSEMEIFQLEQHPQGVGLKDRTLFFERAVADVFEKFYAGTEVLPDHLIHVTCTGYVSPSGAQRIVAKRSAPSVVTHAYHMGCYASIPAIRMAQGYLHHSSQVDVVHTELCTLHMNPLLHTTDQLVVQSLFADGFIKYTLRSEPVGKALKIRSVHEVLLPDSTESMTWRCEDWGLRMTIAKEVPVLIGRALPGFLQTLAQKAGMDAEKLRSEAVFAIHPGGPKIIQQVGKMLNLESKQLAHSQAILQNYGNMSSATLPHVWEKVIQDPEVKEGCPIVSLAFGPGLSISGGVFEKCGS
jgi:predicted naringenin-chalcone synthase